jgi:hypothetical protein
VFDRITRILRERVASGRFVVTVHAEEEMTDDDLMVSDVEQVIACGSIRECQRDRATRERKYRVRGTATDGRCVNAVVKLGPTGKVVIITIYAEKDN